MSANQSETPLDMDLIHEQPWIVEETSVHLGRPKYFIASPSGKVQFYTVSRWEAQGIVLMAQEIVKLTQVDFKNAALIDRLQEERDSLRQRASHAEQLAAALAPFAKFACDEPHIGEPVCNNCVARDAIAAYRQASANGGRERSQNEQFAAEGPDLQEEGSK